MNIQKIFASFEFYAPAVIMIVASILAGILANYFIYKAIYKNDSLQKKHTYLYEFLKLLKGPLYLILPLVTIVGIMYFLELDRIMVFIQLLIKLLVIFSITWSAIELINYLDIWMMRKYKDDFARVSAKFYLIKKSATVIIVILGIAIFLMSFDSLREIGAGLLLSAGVVSSAILFAAKGIFGNIISGFQLAFARPINIGDDLFINGEFGTVEELTLTNVIVKTWDWRRLVIPLNDLIDKPYENWTYPTRDLLGPVFLYLDYSVDLNKVRKALKEIIKKTALWDTRTVLLEVVELGENSMKLRITVSAANAGNLWKLRCYVREELIKFISHNFPGSLPKMQAEVNFSGDTYLSPRV